MASLEKPLLERRSIIGAELAELQELNRRNEELINKIELARRKSSSFELRYYPERYLYRMNINFPAAIYTPASSFYILPISGICTTGLLMTRGKSCLRFIRKMWKTATFSPITPSAFSWSLPRAWRADGFASYRPEPLSWPVMPEATRPSQRLTGSCGIILRNRGLTVTGNSVETSIINISMTNNPKEFVTEIQIPVERP